MVIQRKEGRGFLSLNANNSEVLTDLSKDRARKFGLDPIVMVPTSGTDTLETALCTIEGKGYHNLNLGDYVSSRSLFS